jgi:hypothetical protein
MARLAASSAGGQRRASQKRGHLGKFTSQEPAGSQVRVQSSEYIFKDLAGSKKPDPRISALTETLVVVFAAARGGAKYHHSGAKDAMALKSLISSADEEEIAKRWAQGLRGSGYNSCSTFAELRSKWNNLATVKTDYSPRSPEEQGLKML